MHKYGKYGEAIDVFKKLINSDRSGSWVKRRAWSCLARSFDRLGELEKAINAIKKVLEGSYPDSLVYEYPLNSFLRSWEEDKKFLRNLLAQKAKRCEWGNIVWRPLKLAEGLFTRDYIGHVGFEIGEKIYHWMPEETESSRLGRLSVKLSSVGSVWRDDFGTVKRKYRIKVNLSRVKKQIAFWEEKGLIYEMDKLSGKEPRSGWEYHLIKRNCYHFVADLIGKDAKAVWVLIDLLQFNVDYQVNKEKYINSCREIREYGEYGISGRTGLSDSQKEEVWGELLNLDPDPANWNSHTNYLGVTFYKYEGDEDGVEPLNDSHWAQNANTHSNLAKNAYEQWRSEHKLLPSGTH